MTARSRLLAILAAAVLVVVAGIRAASVSDNPAVIGGPLALLLASSTDLGPSRDDSAQLTVTLPDSAHPETLIEWARAHGMGVRWRPGDDWAVVEGAAPVVATAFDVPVNDYRGRKGPVFYASPQQPSVAAGFTGKGATIVFFEFGGYNQEDLDTFADSSRLARFTPVLVGGQPGPSGSETVMDLEVAHAIAPDAQMVVVNARPTVEGDGAYEKIGRMFESVDRQFPGAVWSLSIGWGCDALVRAADLAPVEAALVTAQKHGTSAFDASGDTGGLECKGGDDWSSPPGPNDIGLDAISSLPSMTSVGGTTLSTDAHGRKSCRWRGTSSTDDWLPMSQLSRIRPRGSELSSASSR